MRLSRPTLSESITLQIESTQGDPIEQELPIKNIHYWYPFNVNFTYVYSTARGYMYLVKDSMYDGENVYKADILKKTKELTKRDGVPFHPHVYRRNRYIINKARRLGVPTIDSNYDKRDLEEGFKLLRTITSTVVQNSIESRLIQEAKNDEELAEKLESDWTTTVYGNMNPQEEELFREVGEMYTMLSVMRKILKGAE